MSHDGQPKWSRETIEDMRRALTAEYSPERGLTDARKGFGGGTIGAEPESEAQRVAEIERAAVEMERAGITGPLPDCMMPDGDMPCAGFRSLAERLHARASTAEAKAESLRAQLAEKERECEWLQEQGHLMATKIARALILIGPGAKTVDGRTFEYIGPRGTYDDIRRALENDDEPKHAD